MESFEYAIRKDVRNNPIVREVDTVRLRAQRRWVAIAGSLVLFGLFYGWQHYELREHGYRIEEMQKQRAVEEETARQLRLEIETLKAPQRIEALATGRLHLVSPTRDDAMVIERVARPDLPAKSVVARRE
jgi:cell division protein FtsL